MGFFSSLINQIGRDAGKTLSNKIFKDSHSTPYRRVGANKITTFRKDKEKIISEFDKAIKINLSFKPNTLISKLIAAYVIANNEIEKMLSDDYLDNEETKYLLEIYTRLIKKIDDIADIFEIRGLVNSKEYTELSNLAERVKLLIKQTLERAIIGCEQRTKYHYNLGKGLEDNSFFWQSSKKSKCRAK